MGTEYLVLMYKTLARTGGSAACNEKESHYSVLIQYRRTDGVAQLSHITLSTGVTDPSLKVNRSESDKD